MDAALHPGAAAPPLRRTAQKRPEVHPRTWNTGADGADLTDASARRRWCALIGPGAVADLMRLATAAERGRSLLRPVNLDTLARHGLVTTDGHELLVRTTFPRLAGGDHRRLHPSLRTNLHDVSWSEASHG
jgi:hypothetical protein